MPWIRILIDLPESRVPPGLDRFLSEHTGMEIFLSSHGEPDAEYDLRVISAARLSYFLSTGRNREGLFFCAGDSRQMRHALILGAADFMREPWDWTELLIRTERALALSQKTSPNPDPGGLTLTELRLFWRLGEGRGQPVPRKVLAQALSLAGQDESRTLDVHIASLRKKLKARLPQWKTPALTSVRNKGYRLDFLAYGAISVVR